MKTFVKFIAMVGVTGYLFFAIFKFVSPADDSLCAGLDVNVEANSDDEMIVDSAMVARLLAKHNIVPDSMRVRDIDLMLVDSILEADPYINETRCYINTKNSLCVDVTIVSPVARVMDASGSDYYVDSKGNVIPAAGRFLDVPLVTGCVDRQWAGVYLPRLVRHLDADTFWSRQVEQINVERDSTVTLVPRKGDLLIRLGHVEKVADKLERLRLFYEEGLPQVGWNRYAEVNLEYDNQIICTKNKKVKK